MQFLHRAGNACEIIQSIKKGYSDYAVLTGNGALATPLCSGPGGWRGLIVVHYFQNVQ
jgi:hypothetical protein